ncbi:unnamed protein product, partial [Ectocarpus sp. 13 AM-2016]
GRGHRCVRAKRKRKGTCGRLLPNIAHAIRRTYERSLTTRSSFEPKLGTPTNNNEKSAFPKNTKQLTNVEAAAVFYARRFRRVLRTTLKNKPSHTKAHGKKFVVLIFVIAWVVFCCPLSFPSIRKNCAK